MSKATGINDAGKIVGTGQPPGHGIIDAYLKTPEDNHVAAVMPVASESPNLRLEVANVAASPSPPGAEKAGEARALLEERLIPRSVSVLARRASARPALAPPWADPLADELAP
jgi:hypothetical protein